MTHGLILLAASSPESLRERFREMRHAASRASSAAQLSGCDEPAAAAPDPVRAAIVAEQPGEVIARVETLEKWLRERVPRRPRVGEGIALGRTPDRPRIGLLFPGQGAPVPSDAGFLCDLLPGAAAVYRHADALAAGQDVAPEHVQLAVLVASIAGLRALAALGVEGDFALGHSIGELAALHWSGALDEGTVLRLARHRGEAMTRHAAGAGAMASIESDEQTFARLVDGASVSVACFNSPRHRVVSGEVGDVERVVSRAGSESGARAMPLRVVGAFHSPLMRDAVPVFERFLAAEPIGRPQRRVYSTITGAELEPGVDLRALLVRQISEPVRFDEALQEAAAGAHLLLEVGPGRMLSRLAADSVEAPTLPLRIGHSTPQAFLLALGAAWVAGSPVQTEDLIERSVGAWRPSGMPQPARFPSA